MDLKYRLLAVDDNEMNLKIIASDLESSGFVVIKALDGESALQILKHDINFDVVLLDLMMPKMDGMHVFQAIKSDLKVKHVPVIMVSAAPKDKQINAFLETGSLYYIKKPYKLSELLNTIKVATDFG